LNRRPSVRSSASSRNTTTSMRFSRRRATAMSRFGI
jgi:hypothetical protein